MTNFFCWLLGLNLFDFFDSLPSFIPIYFLSFPFLPWTRRSISERQDAVQEILESHSLTLNSIRALLSHLPDLERGICSIYHKKVKTPPAPINLFFTTYFDTVRNRCCQLTFYLSSSAKICGRSGTVKRWSSFILHKNEKQNNFLSQFLSASFLSLPLSLSILWCASWLTTGSSHLSGTYLIVWHNLISHRSHFWNVRRFHPTCVYVVQRWERNSGLSLMSCFMFNFLIPFWQENDQMSLNTHTHTTQGGLNCHFAHL